MHVIDRILVRLLFGKIQVEFEMCAVRPHQEEIADGVGTDLVEQVVERVAQAAQPRVEQAVEEAARTAGINIAVSRDQIEDVVRRLAKDIIEEVAWEVVPELTEQIVSEEFNKFREVFLKAKKH